MEQAQDSEALSRFIGHPALDLPTPSVVLSLPTLNRNIQTLLDDVKNLGIGFRAHVKTLKCCEITRMMLGDIYKKVVVSTLREIRGLLPLVKEGVIDEVHMANHLLNPITPDSVLYGVPCRPGALPELARLSEEVKVLLLIDHEDQLASIEAFRAKEDKKKPWEIFIKVDCGYHRAGIPPESPRMKALILRAERSAAVSIHGFYCHGGHSYYSQTPDSAAAVLQQEVGEALKAAEMMTKKTAIVISFGATPTAHVVKTLHKALPTHMALELHAGNFPCNDLQQVATGSVKESDQSVRVLAEVCSVYPERNEAIINAGLTALTKETSSFRGYGKVVSSPDWSVGRLSQEHGILTCSPAGIRDVTQDFVIGNKIFLYIQHACITAGVHYHYYVVDEDDIVREIWHPWRGW